MFPWAGGGGPIGLGHGALGPLPGGDVIVKYQCQPLTGSAQRAPLPPRRTPLASLHGSSAGSSGAVGLTVRGWSLHAQELPRQNPV